MRAGGGALPVDPAGDRQRRPRRYRRGRPWTDGPADANKRLTLQSAEGAGLTVIDAGSTSGSGLRASADGVRLGKPGKPAPSRIDVNTQEPAP
jgi:hypothetical protein